MARPTRTDARILDDHTVSETLRVYGQMSADYRDLFTEQGRRWQADPALSATEGPRRSMPMSRSSTNRSRPLAMFSR
ncbi:MAG TPA: hypothetical protein VE196_04275 [Pseudonocardiaceae bacterium]|jgi:hypothetical protein|nr:hypothetical protein [Pseudonocardiaceae bacterium]